MATAIVSTATRQAGLEPISVVLLWLALLAFLPLAVLDVGQARHPLALLHRAGERGVGFTALGFVADTCVLGARLHGGSALADAAAPVLLVIGAIVWLAILTAILRGRSELSAGLARGEWLLAVVATEGLAILTGELAPAGTGHPLRAAAVALWLFGVALYGIVAGLLAVRLVNSPLRPGELSPDWWIVMGGLAIICLGSMTVRRAAGWTFEGVVGFGAWGVATLFIPVLAGAELWQARVAGRPRFTPARWTMVFPLGMYSASSQLAGHVLRLPWLATIGRWWVVVAVSAWTLVAAGEGHHAFTDPPG
jgi:tellurite resistance protein TehA-like permease